MKKMGNHMDGIFPPITTPFKVNGEVDYKALQSNVEKYLKIPFRGLVVQGSNGEFAHLTDEERVECIRVVSSLIKTHDSPQILVAGAGCVGTRHTIEMVNNMARAGADCALVATPWFFAKAMDDDALVQHFTDVADASHIPVILYNVPKFTGVNLNVSAVVRLAGHKNIIGVKDSGGNITQIAQMVDATSDQDFHVLAGSAGFLYAALSVGAIGGVCALANIAGRECCELVNLYNAGEFKKARQLQYRLIAPNTSVTATYGIAGLKYVLDLLGYYGGPVRKPLKDLKDAGKREKLRKIMQKLGVLTTPRL